MNKQENDTTPDCLPVVHIQVPKRKLCRTYLPCSYEASSLTQGHVKTICEQQGTRFWRAPI